MIDTPVQIFLEKNKQDQEKHGHNMSFTHD